MSVVTITINGELVSANSEQTLLAVLREHNVPIPTLCHLDGLSDRGGCRLCLVEIEGSPKLQASCVTPVQEGMVVHTDLNQPWGDSDSCTSCGKCVQVCPTGALFAKGSTVAEMEKRSDFLQWIVGGREKKRWNWE